MTFAGNEWLHRRCVLASFQSCLVLRSRCPNKLKVGRKLSGFQVSLRCWEWVSKVYIYRKDIWSQSGITANANIQFLLLIILRAIHILSLTKLLLFTVVLLLVTCCTIKGFHQGVLKSMIVWRDTYVWRAAICIIALHIYYTCSVWNMNVELSQIENHMLLNHKI